MFHFVLSIAIFAWECIILNNSILKSTNDVYAYQPTSWITSFVHKYFLYTFVRKRIK